MCKFKIGVYSFFLAIILLPCTSGHAQGLYSLPLKNVSGSITTPNGTFNISGADYDRGVPGHSAFNIFYDSGGYTYSGLVLTSVAELGQQDSTYTGGSFFSADLNNGKGGVSCTFTQPDGYSGHFTYARYFPKIKLSSPSDTVDLTLKMSNPPMLHFHMWIDDTVRDESFVFLESNVNFYARYVTKNSSGKVLSDTTYWWPWASPVVDTTAWLPPAIVAPGVYTDQLSFEADTMAYVPSAPLTLCFHVNPAVYQSSCNGLPWLSFDASYDTVGEYTQTLDPFNNGTGWKGISTGIIADSGLVVINNFLRFHGIMLIDTVNSLISSSGKYYVWTKLPAQFASGIWGLGSGLWPTFSYSCKGLISIAQSLLSDSIAGFKFGVDSIYFITDSTGVNGIRLGATVTLPFTLVPTACGTDSSPANLRVSIAPIEITGNGIGGAIHVSNVGIYPGFCVKDLFGSYYTYPDSLSFGAEFKAPFVDKLALSAGWVRGQWDAVSVSYQQATGGIPIGQTGMFLTGARGSASGWHNPPLKCSVGGTFDDVTHEFMEWAGDISYLEPSTLSGSLKASFLNIPPLGWQAVITGKATLDWNHFAKLEGTVQEGTLGNGYVFNGNAALTYTWSPEKDLIGTGNGSYSIPKLFKNNLSSFTDWVNSYLPLQIADAEMSLKNRLMRGNISIWIVSAHLAVNLNLPSTDPNFIDFGLGTIPLNRSHQAGKFQVASLPLDSIRVPTNSAVVVIRIRSSNGLPSASTLIDPAGKAHTSAPADSLIQYQTFPTTNHGFWVMKNPMPGDWILSMPQRSITDTVDADAEPVDEPLHFTTNQVGKHVTINWTPLSTGDSADVTAYLDDSSSGYTGFLVAIANDKDGTLSFDLNDSLPGCQYYLYAARDNRAYVSQSYATMPLDNSKSSALPPTNPIVQHMGGDSILLRWQPTTSSGLEAYAIRVSDQNGVDSIYGSVDISVDSAILVVQNPENKRIRLIAYGNGLQSCWSNSVSATANVTHPSGTIPENVVDLQFWPNPAENEGELSFTLNDREAVTVTILDILGRKMFSPVVGNFGPGTHTSPVDLSTLIPGTYYCRLQAGSLIKTIKFSIQR